MEAIKKENPKELRPEEATNSRLELRYGHSWIQIQTDFGGPEIKNVQEVTKKR
jgi:hypothetical protein